MRTKKFHLASRLAVLALALTAVFIFTACGGDDDDNQPPVGKEEVLSDETTPIDFTFNEYPSWEPHIFFDYAGSKYIGTDTLSKGGKKTIDLRQGKHRILWFSGLSNNESMYSSSYGNALGFEQKYFSGIHYNPDEETVVSFDSQAYSDKISYSEKEITITPYLMPEQKVKFDIHVTSRVVVNVTDYTDKMAQISQSMSYGYGFDEKIGALHGLPFIKKIGLKDNRYDKASNGTKQEVKVHIIPTLDVLVSVEEIEMLCPLNGIDGIQLTADVKDVDGSNLTTTAIPTFSVQRGYTTTLTGPLFSGSTSDWTVTMEPYN